MLAAVLAACAREPSAASPYRGVAVDPPRPRPAFTLTDTDGRPFDFGTQTAGRLTLLFFGFTNCPDICPVHFANLAAGMRALSPVDRQKIRVVFVTTDPARDTLQRIRMWLDNFNPAFIGLRGTLDELAKAEEAAGVSPSGRLATAPTAGDTADYGVAHAAQILVYTADDSLRVAYPFGVRQQDWAADLPKLLRVTPAVR